MLVSTTKTDLSPDTVVPAAVAAVVARRSAGATLLAAEPDTLGTAKLLLTPAGARARQTWWAGLPTAGLLDGKQLKPHAQTADLSGNKQDRTCINTLI